MIVLRAAVPSDEDLLLAWRNDPLTRAASFQQREVTAGEHKVWFARKLADPSVLILIAEKEGEPAAQVRFDAEDGVAEVDITVAPKERGRGVGRETLRLALLEARTLAVEEFRARVKPGNKASLAIFRVAGFTEEKSGNDRVKLTKKGERTDG